jgi:hypothetical protein
MTAWNSCPSQFCQETSADIAVNDPTMKATNYPFHGRFEDKELSLSPNERAHHFKAKIDI